MDFSKILASRLTAFLLFISFPAFSQKFVEPEKMKQFNIIVNADDCTIKTQILSHEENITAYNDRTYMWYSSQKIMETMGGFEGKLIHGKYRAFFLNSQLKEQGQLKYGLKDKEWKYWYADGKLREVINWKNGKKSGIYLLYNDNGLLMARGNFRNDKLHGKFFTYDNDNEIRETKRYKNGSEVIQRKKEKKERSKKSPAAEKKKRKNKNGHAENKSDSKEQVSANNSI